METIEISRTINSRIIFQNSNDISKMIFQKWLSLKKLLDKVVISYQNTCLITIFR